MKNRSNLRSILMILLGLLIGIPAGILLQSKNVTKQAKADNIERLDAVKVQAKSTTDSSNTVTVYADEGERIQISPNKDFVKVLPIIPFSPKDSLTPIIDDGVSELGHKFGTAKSIVYQGLVQFSENNNNNEVNPTLPTGTTMNSNCIEAIGDNITIGYDFKITIANDKLAALSGNGTVAFKLFKDNDALAGANFFIKMNDNLIINDSNIEVQKAAYQEGLNGYSSIHFITMIQIPNTIIEANAVYSVVGEIIDDVQNDHINDPLSGYVDLDCDNLISQDKLQYYECIKANNTHKRDHIMIESFVVCSYSE